MSRPPTVFMRSVNLLLQYIADSVAVGEVLPSEQRMAGLCDGSRSAIRSALAHFQARGLINDLHDRRVLRKPARDDYFDVVDLRTGADRIQQVLLERIYQRDMAPGTEFSEAELARAAETSTVSVREFLIGFARSGLIEKKRRGGWRLCAFDRDFAMELADVRQMFEFAAIERFGRLAPDDPAFARLSELIALHDRIDSAMPASHTDFPALDREFHAFLISLLDNRFAEGFYNIVSLVFHYHYQWDKDQELPRNQYAVHEHLDILHALARRDVAGAREAMTIHLNSARSTLLQSVRTRERRAHAGRATGADRPAGTTARRR